MAKKAPMMAVLVLVLGAGSLFGREDSDARLRAATAVLREIMGTPDRSIPNDLLDKSHCVAIVPGLKKGAFVFGAQYGKGYFLCRTDDAKSWSSPGTIRLEGGSFGLQIGGSETDVVLLVMNESGMNRLLSSKFTLGGGASVAAGPVGRTAKAETDALLTAEILSWSRSRGVFAGISLDGSTLRQDLDGNRELYGEELTNREIIEKKVAPPGVAKDLVSLLTKYSAKKP